MNDERDLIMQQNELAQLGPIYEIRVSGRLEGERWSEWFDGMTVTVVGSETVLHGRLPDQAALYGALARLRDLALPLVSINAYEELPERPPRRARRRGGFDWLQVPLYLLMIGGLAALTVFLTEDVGLHVGLSLGLMFGTMGGITFNLYRRRSGWTWLVIAILTWLGSLISLIVYVIEMEWVPVSLAMALLSFALGGILFLLIQRSRSQPAPLPEEEWEPLGSRAGAEEPGEWPSELR